MNIEQIHKIERDIIYYFDSFGWNVLSRLIEGADEFLEIGVHVLKHQVQHCLPFLVLALLHIH